MTRSTLRNSSATLLRPSRRRNLSRGRCVGNIDLTGIIKTVRLGNPHGILKIDVEGEEWTAEVGQPWHNERAGLRDAPRARLVGHAILSMVCWPGALVCGRLIAFAGD